MLSRFLVWYRRKRFFLMLWCLTYARLRAEIAIDECHLQGENEGELCHVHALRYNYWTRYADRLQASIRWEERR